MAWLFNTAPLFSKKVASAIQSWKMLVHILQKKTRARQVYLKSSRTYMDRQPIITRNWATPTSHTIQRKTRGPFYVCRRFTRWTSSLASATKGCLEGSLTMAASHSIRTVVVMSYTGCVANIISYLSFKQQQHIKVVSVWRQQPGFNLVITKT